MITPEDKKKIQEIFEDLLTAFEDAIKEIPVGDREAVLGAGNILERMNSEEKLELTVKGKKHAMVLNKILRCAGYLQMFYHQLGLGLTIGIKKDGKLIFVSYPLDPETAAIEKKGS